MATINTNVVSLTAQRALAGTSRQLSTAMARLSSGMRVNSAKDDAAGLAIAERMNAQTRGMNVAIRNANDAISLAQTAESALGAIGNNLQRMRELAVQAANGTNGSDDIVSLDNEYTLLVAENNRIATATEFNGQSVIGTVFSSFNFQIGANAVEDNDVISVESAPYTGNASTLGTETFQVLLEIELIDGDIDAVTAARATWGAAQNRFDSVIANLQSAAENSAAARGRIVDADYAMETANLSRAQVLQQAGTAMVAQANSSPQSVLQLLK